MDSKKNKKAAIEVSFNWIFVLIAGAVILLFFISMINTQRDKSNTNIALTVKTELKSIFTGAILSDSRQLNVDIPKTTIKFSCDFSTCDDFESSNNPTCYSQYEIGETGINEQTLSEIIFAPSEVSGKKLLTWTLAWNVPFYVTNFLFITGSNVKYYFVNEGNSLDLFNKLPDTLNKELIPLNSLQYEQPKGNDNFKIIFFETDPSTITISSSIISAAHKSNINALRVVRSSKQLEFYEFNGYDFVIKDSVNYLTETEVYAAIFSDSADFYKCNMQKAFNRFYILSKLLKYRSEKLYNLIPDDHRCKALYNPNTNGLNNIYENSVVFSNPHIQQLTSELVFLSNANYHTLENSCQLIY